MLASLGDCAFSRCFADDPGGQALALQGEAAARTLQGSLLSGQKQGRMNGLFAHRCEETAQGAPVLRAVFLTVGGQHVQLLFDGFGNLFSQCPDALGII